MLRARDYLAICMLMTSGCNYADTVKQPCINMDTDYSQTLSCYRQKLESLPLNYNLINKEQLAKTELRHYQLTSQRWPEDKAAQTAWQHNVDIYIPDKPLEKRALLVINDGTNHNIDNNPPVMPADFSKDTLASLANRTRTIVISVSNVPNQYITLPADNTPRREDDAVAVSWSGFLQDPQHNSQLPLHVPMTAAVSQAMSLAQRELTPWKIDKFIVSGISKRGWTSWLTLVSDARTDAIVPFVFDLSGVRQALAHMYRSYGNNWPVAFYPYYMHNIDTTINTEPFKKLMKIIDPLQYMDSDYHSRLLAPKYIINASGDDFYVPDNTRFYFDQLPGEKSLRVVANSGHYDIKSYTESSLAPFINRIQQDKKLPVIQVLQQQQKLTLSFSEKPMVIKHWTAVNSESRDFRYACGIHYTSVPIPASTSVTINPGTPQKGWEASYVEAIFSDGFIATSQVYITPDDKYPTSAPPAAGNCKTLPGRGLGGETLH